ncbi:hypothetical protein R6Q59_028405 [Mikania micrantha]
MAVGEIILSAFISVLFEKLASSDMIKLARSAGIHSELDKLRTKLELIQAVLVDAGQKHITQRSVELWLNELQHLAYEIDDVLDDLVTEATRRRLKNQESDASTSNNTTSKVLKFIPNKFHAVKYGRKMSSKIDEITTKLRDLDNEKNSLGLITNVERSSGASRRLEETSLIDESEVIGREGDTGALLGKLLGSESSSNQSKNFNVVTVVGMGGIGKTTLAQLLYNDKRVKDRFEFRAWVCVSDEYNVFNISKAIFQSVGGENKDFATLNLLQEALAEKLSKKMFLIVLDDVWNENQQEWELLQRPFTGGASGSKVLVTTRNATVASAMDSVQPYDLELLPDEEALSLFSQHASDKQNFDDVNQKLKMYGDKIVKKCGRLPLALKTLGRVFRGKSDEEWEELLDSEIWNSKNESNILPALMLSYYDLPPHLKQIFAYCSLFPKDCMFDKDELILLWMAEGFLYQPNGDKQMEILGGEYFKELVSRSFFQSSANNKFYYTMHDLINDMAKSVAGEFFFMVDDKMDVYDRIEALKKCHHLSFLRELYGAYKKFKALEICRGLRAFLVMPARGIYNWPLPFYISNSVLIEVIPLLKSLRVLNLARYNITHVPESIGRLKHLSLPSTLKSLDISLCNNVEVSWLDNNFLSSVQHLYISNMVNLRLFPDGCFVHLTTLNINDCDNLESIPSNGYGFLPSHCLRYLKIADCKNLKSFPHEHLQSSKSLVEIKIHGCPNLDYTFPGGLWPPNLSELRIGKLKKPISEWGMQNFPTSLVKLSFLNGEDSGVVTFAKIEEEDTSSLSVLLPSSLTSLSLKYFNELESLSEGLQHLTCLQHLKISNCPKLRDLPETLLPLLSSLKIYSGGFSEELIRKCSRRKKGKYWLIISQIPNLDLGSCFDN